jgi:hypothetical protein
MQGSAYMAVALSGLSDCDFYVRMDDSVPDVTRAQRVQIANDVADELRRRGLRYADVRLGEKRIHGVGGDDGAPDFDVVFARFTGAPPSVAPVRRALSPAVQLSVCALRLMPEVYTDLMQPQSSALIEFVEAEEAQAPGGARAAGEQGSGAGPPACGPQEGAQQHARTSRAANAITAKFLPQQPSTRPLTRGPLPPGFAPLLRRVVGSVAGGPPPAFRLALQRGQPRLSDNPAALQTAAEHWAAAARRLLLRLDAAGF